MTSPLRITRHVGVAAMAAVVTIASSLGAAGTGGRAGEEKAHVAPEEADTVATETDSLASAPYRTHFGRTDLYIPTFFHPVDGRYDVIIHFHGLAAAQEANVERARVNAVVASVNIGIMSGPYESAFKEPWVFPNLVNVIQKAVAKSGRASGAHMGRIALSAWSAGYGSVSSILRVPANAKKIDAVLLADGLHTDFTDEKHHVVDEGPLGKYAAIAQAAIRGDKLFALTHSSIKTEGYANTTETIGELLKMVSVPKEMIVADGPRGMMEIYEAHSGSFHVRGYLGTGVKDHIDHIWGMSDTMLPYLRERWSR